jgi:imidazolonepropionase-like amidohydrolase
MIAIVRTSAFTLVGLVLLASRALLAQDVAIRNVHVIPVSDERIENGVVLIRDGRIAAVGAAGTVRLPDGVEVVDGAGWIVTPGFIDANTRMIPVPRGTNALTRPELRVSNHIGQLRTPPAFGQASRSPGTHPWVMDGVTTVYAGPPPTSLVAGFGTIVKLDGDSFGEVIEPAAALHVTMGDLPSRNFDRPTTRQGMAAALRQWLWAARGALDSGSSTFELGEPAAAVENLDPIGHPLTEDVRAVLTRRMPVRFRAQSPEDVLTALRIAEEFGLSPVIEGATGAHMVTSALARAGATVVVGPAMVGSSGNTPDAFGRTPEGPALLARADVPFALSTEASRGRSVSMEAVIARGHGLSAAAALTAVTLDAARILGIDDRVGSLEVGKDGDVVLWSSDPVGTWAQAELVIVGGKVIYRR